MADEDRISALLEAHGGAVRAYVVRRAGPGIDPADVVAGVFEVAWRRLRSIPEEPGTRPYLLGVARKVLANAERTSRRQRRLNERLAEQAIVHDPDGPVRDPTVDRSGRR